MSRRLLLVSIVGLACLWIGCASQVKTGVCTGPEACTHHGVAYHLPKRLVKLTIERSKLVPAEAQAAAAAARTAVEIAQKASADAEADAKAKRAIAEAAQEPGLAPALMAATTAEAVAVVAKARLVQAQQKQLAAEEKLRLAQEGADFADAIDLTLLPPVPDTSKTYVADLSHNAFVDDDVKIAVSANGLLQSTSSVHADRTGDVLVELAKTFAGVVRLSGVMGTSRADRAGRAQKPFRYEWIFDPALQTESCAGGSGRAKSEASDATPESLRWKNVAADVLETAGYGLSVCRDGNGGPHVGDPASRFGEAPRHDGLVYRRPVPYVISLSSGAAAPRATRVAVAVTLPNDGPEVIVPVSGRPFTTATHGVAFEDGMLVRRDIVAPSEVLGVASIPPRILEQIVSLPTELLQLKIDTTAQETTLLQNEKLQLDAYKALLDAQKALQGPGAPAVP